MPNPLGWTKDTALSNNKVALGPLTLMDRKQIEKSLQLPSPFPQCLLQMQPKKDTGNWRRAPRG